MLPLQAHGYRNGLSASPGFRQIRQTSPSSSSSIKSYLPLLLISLKLFEPGEEATDDVELDFKGAAEEDDDDDDAASASGPISIEQLEIAGGIF